MTNEMAGSAYILDLRYESERLAGTAPVYCIFLSDQADTGYAKPC